MIVGPLVSFSVSWTLSLSPSPGLGGSPGAGSVDGAGAGVLFAGAGVLIAGVGVFLTGTMRIGVGTGPEGLPPWGMRGVATGLGDDLSAGFSATAPAHRNAVNTQAMMG